MKKKKGPSYGVVIDTKSADAGNKPRMPGRAVERRQRAASILKKKRKGY